MFEWFYIIWISSQFLFGIIGAWMLGIWRVDGESTLAFCVSTVKEFPVTCLALFLVLPILITETVFLNILFDVIIAFFSRIASVLYLADEFVRSKFK